MNICHRLVRLIATLAVCLMPATAPAQIPQFDSLYVFGDSLVDNGNLFALTKTLRMEPAIPPSQHPFQTYFEGRFSNGYVGVEYLWQRLSGHAPGSDRGLKPFFRSFRGNTAAVDFGFGGTGTPYLDQTPGGEWAPGLKGQVELFRISLRGRKPSRHALYAIATGANDYRNDPFNVPMQPPEVVGNVIDSIVTLYHLGARHVMVFDLPDLGLIPANSGNPEPASQISALHNLILENALNDLQAQLPELRLIQIKLDSLFRDLLPRLESQVPALALLGPPGTVVCLFVDPSLCQDVPPTLFNRLDLGFLFWDIVHPTTEVHSILGDYVYDRLANSY